MRRGETLRSRQRGLGWIFVLLLLAVVSAASAGVAARWADQRERQQEQELLWVGNAYAQALASYRAATPGGVPRFPASLSALLEDRRGPVLRRHLRQLYPDPVTGHADWLLLRDSQGDVAGLRSASMATPWRRQAMQLASCDVAPATHYSDWVFTPRP